MRLPIGFVLEGRTLIKTRESKVKSSQKKMHFETLKSKY
jgi:hypothetical protein